MKKNTITASALIQMALMPFAIMCMTTLNAATVDNSTITWTGTADSNWANPANWNLNRAPTVTDYIGIGYGSPTLLDITNDGSTDLICSVGGLSVTPSTGAYTISLRGNSNALAILNVGGGGFYAVNNSDNDLPIKIVLNEYSKLLYTGGNSTATYPAIINAPGRSTLWGAALTMHANSSADISGASSTVLLSSLNMEQGSTITTGNNALQINRASTIGGSITSTRTSGEALRVNNAVLTTTGVITLPGSSYVLVRTGPFQVDGVIRGNINLQGSAAASVGGSGFIVGTITANNASAVAPGTSTQAGLLTVTGTVNMLDGSAINLNFFTTSKQDHLNISGGLALAMTGTGAGVDLGVTRDESSFVVKNGRYKVITVDGDITGTFNPKLVHNFGPLAEDSNWDIVQTANGWDVYVNIVHSDFSRVSGLTSNQYVIAEALDTIQAQGALPDALIMSIDSQKSITAYGQVLNQLGPQSYQSWFPAAIAQTSALGSSIENRLAVSDEKFRETKKFDVYAQASRNTSSKDTSENNEYYEINPEEILVGVDYAFSPSYLAGLLYAYDKTEYTLDDAGSTGDSKSSTFGIYGRYRRGNLQASLIGFYGTDNYTADRNVSITGLGTFATADTDGTRYGGRALVSYTFKPAWFDFAPTLGLQYLKWEADGFTEDGNASEATLVVNKQKADSTIGTFGVQISRNFEILKGKAVIRPFLNAYWAYRISSGERNLTATVMSQTVSVKAAQPERNGWHIEGGASLDYYNGLSLFASYGNDSNVIVDQTVSIRAGIGYRF